MPFWKVKFCWSGICTTGGTHPFLYLYFGNFSNYSFLYENNNSFNNNNNNLTMNNKQCKVLLELYKFQEGKVLLERHMYHRWYTPFFVSIFW